VGPRLPVGVGAAVLRPTSLCAQLGGWDGVAAGEGSVLLASQQGLKDRCLRAASPALEDQRGPRGPGLPAPSAPRHPGGLPAPMAGALPPVGSMALRRGRRHGRMALPDADGERRLDHVARVSGPDWTPWMSSIAWPHPTSIGPPALDCVTRAPMIVRSANGRHASCRTDQAAVESSQPSARW
jgi:hypothetical protein